MGFFSDLVDVTPHRTIAEKARDFCFDSSLSQSEYALINQYDIDREEYVKVRNVCHISMFIAFFQFLDSKHPESRYGIAYTHFQQLYWDYYHDSGESTGYATWEQQLEDFCQRVTGKKISDLDSEQQAEFGEQVAIYQAQVQEFFKKHQRKLSESIQ